jgi:hypothetical protein
MFAFYLFTLSYFADTKIICFSEFSIIIENIIKIVLHFWMVGEDTHHGPPNNICDVQYKGTLICMMFKIVLTCKSY